MRSSCLLIQATLLLLTVSPASAQTMAVLQGRVLDPSGAAVPGASVVVRNSATGFTSTTSSDAEGRYHVPAIPAGAYQVTAEAPGFRSERIEALTFEVGRTLVRDFQLAVDTRREAVVVSAELPLLDRATSVVGHVVSAQTVQEIPLNGRHFVDLGIAGARIGRAVADRILDARRSAAPARSRSRPPATAKKPSATSSTA